MSDEVHYIFKERPDRIYAGRMGVHTNGIVTPNVEYTRVTPDTIILSRKALEGMKVDLRTCREIHKDTARINNAAIDKILNGEV